MLANWLADCGQVLDEGLVRKLESELVDSLATARHSAGMNPAATDRTSA
jgi:hypothetical protein